MITVAPRGRGGAVTLDVSQLKLAEGALAWIAKDRQELIFRRAINRVGDMAYTRVIRIIGKEAGIKRSEIVKEVGRYPARGAMTYVIKARGRHLSLKRFAPRQTSKGITAAPWNNRRLYPGSFFGPGGHVYWRKTRKRLPIELLTGPAIPAELVRDTVVEQVEALVRAKLQERLRHEVQRAFAAARRKYSLG
jgi:hypothetical protein